MRDYYEVLGVAKDSNEEVIKKAYRKLSKQYHPDINQEAGAVEKFKEVNEAYEILGDSKKRQNYDRFGTANPQQGGFNPFGFNPFDIFSDLNPRNVNLDRAIDETITFKESILGCKRTISIPTKKPCDKCAGNGFLKVETCSTCGGRGQLVQQQGGWQMQSPCHHCNGRGKKYSDKCADCIDGYIDLPSENIEISIPAGISDNNAVRLTGKGNYGPNGKRGSLYIQISVLPHEFLERNGLELHCRVPVSYTQLLLGGEVTVPLIQDTVVAKIPPNTSIGATLKLKDQGISLNGNRGNLYLHLYCPINKNLPEEYLNKLKELAELENKYPAAEITEFNTKMVNYE